MLSLSRRESIFIVPGALVRRLTSGFASPPHPTSTDPDHKPVGSLITAVVMTSWGMKNGMEGRIHKRRMHKEGCLGQGCTKKWARTCQPIRLETSASFIPAGFGSYTSTAFISPVLSIQHTTLQSCRSSQSPSSTHINTNGALTSALNTLDKPVALCLSSIPFIPMTSIHNVWGTSQRQSGTTSKLDGSDTSDRPEPSRGSKSTNIHDDPHLIARLLSGLRTIPNRYDPHTRQR